MRTPGMSRVLIDGGCWHLACVLKTRVFFYFPRNPAFRCLAGTCCVYTHMRALLKNGFLSGKMFPCLSKFGSETHGHSNTPCQITVLCHVLPCASHRLGWLKNSPYTPSCPSSRRQYVGRGNEHAQVEDAIAFGSTGSISHPQLCLYCGEHFQCIPASSTFSLGFASPLL